MGWDVFEVAAAETYPLRAELLRSDRMDLDLHLPEDDVPGAFHLAVTDDSGAIIGVASATPAAPMFTAPMPAWRLRQMAVATEMQGCGVGTAIFGALLERLRSRHAATLWAESRDRSLGFYMARGMHPVPGRHHVVSGVDYTDVVLDLRGERVPEPTARA